MGQKEIAASLGVDQATVSKWLNISDMNGHKAKVDNRVKGSPHLALQRHSWPAALQQP